jgi:hypothetical protein
MRAFRRVAVPFLLAQRRIRRGGSRIILVVAGIATASAALAAVVVGTIVAEERTLARSLEQLPPPIRTVRIGFFGLPAQTAEYAAVDGPARRRLALVSPRRPTATVLLRESSIGNAFVALGGVERLERWVRLRSGRVPRLCVPARCEVLLLRGAERVPRVSGLRFVIVGRATLKTTALFGDAVPADRNALDRARLPSRLQRVARYHQPAPPPLLLANGVGTLARAPALSTVYRSYGWVLPLLPGDARPWNVGELVAQIEQARTALQARATEYDVAAPTTELRAARSRAQVGHAGCSSSGAKASYSPWRSRLLLRRDYAVGTSPRDGGSSGLARRAGRSPSRRRSRRPF